MKALKSKTINFAVILAVFGAAQISLPAIQGFIPAEAFGWITLVVSMAVAALRAVTTKPLQEK